MQKVSGQNDQQNCLKLAAADSGTPVAASSKTCGISRRTLRDWVSREGFPLKKLGRNAVLPADAGKQLHQRIVRLRELGFGLLVVQVCKEQSMQNPWNPSL
jgi:hypothetical protein